MLGGDSLKHIAKLPQPTDKYFTEAMEQFPNDTKYAVFSDDVDFCIKYFNSRKFPGKEFQMVEPNFHSPLGDLGMMASTKGNIIVNSTFSWMAAYLNPNPFAKVVCPSKGSWFGPGYYDKLSAEGLMVPGWTQISY
jgi:hypothetical protein